MDSKTHGDVRILQAEETDLPFILQLQIWLS